MTNREKVAIEEIEQQAFDLALIAIQKASSLVLEYWPNPSNPLFNQKLEITTIKSEGIANYATIADEASEALIKQILYEKEALSQFGYYGEEGGLHKGTAEYLWVVDPVDGTIPFSKGLPDFGVMIGLLKDGVPCLGVIALPARGEILAARKGKGVRHFSLGDPRRQFDLHHRRQPLDRTVVIYDVGYTQRREQVDQLVSPVIDKVAYLTSYCSASVSNFYVATGVAGAYFNKNPKLFDVVAPSIVIEELGGIVTDIRGNPIDWHAPHTSYLAALDPAIHKQLVGLLN